MLALLGVGRVVALRRLRNLLSLLRSLVAPSLRGRSAVDLVGELEQLSADLIRERDLRQRVAILSRLGPVARELHRRGVT